MNGAAASTKRFSQQGFRSKAAASLDTGSSGGGNVDDILKRLGVIEATASDTRAQVMAILAVLPHLATKAELSSLKAELKEDIQSVRTEMHSMEASLIKWIVGTAIATAAVAFGIARFVS